MIDPYMHYTIIWAVIKNNAVLRLLDKSSI